MTRLYKSGWLALKNRMKKSSREDWSAPSRRGGLNPNLTILYAQDVQADEDAFRKTQEIEREKQAHNRRVQSDVDRARDQNAKRKMDKVQSREWDSGKPSVDRRGPGQQPNRLDPPPPQSEGAEATPDWASSPAQENVESGSWTRGGNPPSHRGRGRGRGRGSNHPIHRDSGTPTGSRDAPDTANNSSTPAT